MPKPIPQGELRLVRPRRHQPSGGRAVQERCRHRHRACALSRCGAGGPGSAGGAGPAGCPRCLGAAAAYPVRQHQGVGGNQQDPSALLPDVPTTAEIGLPTVLSDNWYGLAAPAGVPQPVLDRIHAAAVAVLKTKEAAEPMMAQGAARPADDAGRVHRLRPAGTGEVGTRGQGKRRQDGVTANAAQWVERMR